MPFGAGALLWSLAHTPTTSTSDGSTAATIRQRWFVLRSADSTDHVTVRTIHRSRLRPLLVSLRESLARAHAAKLAELPLFAPLTPVELIAFCRRATEVEFAPDAPLSPVAPPGSITDSLALQVHPMHVCMHAGVT